jgi:RimJ/RimL family protein N-acetyltransferase
MPLIEINASQVSAPIRALFRTDDPQAPRCFAVLEGIAPRGRIFVDDLHAPRWGLVQESADQTLYLGGDVSVDGLHAAFAVLRREGPVLVGMWPDDPRLTLLPSGPVYDGLTLEFYDRPIGQGLVAILQTLPGDCDLHPIDRTWVMQTEWGPGDVALWGGLDTWEARCLGYCLVRDGRVLSEAMVGPPVLGLREMGVFTRETARGQRYGTLAAARTILAVEALGGRTYWNCAKQNLPSVAMAYRLGYTRMREYRCLVWA